MSTLIAFAIGLLFGVGLLVSGMTDPANVLGFLDVAGAWNPRLAFVMAGAVLVAAPAFAWMRRNRRTLGGAPVVLPDRTTITPRLVAGAAIFGLGWGLAGICPGPALVLLSQGSGYAWTFVLAILAGLALADRFPATAAPGSGEPEAVAAPLAARGQPASPPRPS